MKTMMKVIAMMLIAVMMMSGAALAAGQIRTDGKVNVRKGAGRDYGVKGTVNAGTVLNYDDTHKDERGVTWYHITNGKGGWVSSMYATQLSGSGKATAKNAKHVVATGNMNVRTGPGLDHAEMGVMKTGRTAKFLGKVKKDARGVAWYKISFEGENGWVSSKYAALQK